MIRALAFAAIVYGATFAKQTSTTASSPNATRGNTDE